MQTTELNTFFTELSMHLDSHHLQPNELETFFDGLAYRLTKFKPAKKQMDRFIASDFSVFSYISVDEGR
jgi:hypothetical protein